MSYLVVKRHLVVMVNRRALGMDGGDSLDSTERIDLGHLSFGGSSAQLVPQRLGFRQQIHVGEEAAPPEKVVEVLSLGQEDLQVAQVDNVDVDSEAGENVPPGMALDNQTVGQADFSSDLDPLVAQVDVQVPQKVAKEEGEEAKGEQSPEEVLGLLVGNVGLSQSHRLSNDNEVENTVGGLVEGGVLVVQVDGCEQQGTSGDSDAQQRLEVVALFVGEDNVQRHAGGVDHG